MEIRREIASESDQVTEQEKEPILDWVHKNIKVICSMTV